MNYKIKKYCENYFFYKINYLHTKSYYFVINKNKTPEISIARTKLIYSYKFIKQ